MLAQALPIDVDDSSVYTSILRFISGATAHFQLFLITVLDGVRDDHDEST